MITETWYAVTTHATHTPHSAYPSLVTACRVMTQLQKAMPNVQVVVYPVQVTPPDTTEVEAVGEVDCADPERAGEQLEAIFARLAKHPKTMPVGRNPEQLEAIFARMAKHPKTKPVGHSPGGQHINRGSIR